MFLWSNLDGTDPRMGNIKLGQFVGWELWDFPIILPTFELILDTLPRNF